MSNEHITWQQRYRIFISCINFIYFADMSKKFRTIYIALLGVIFLFSCVKKQSRKEIEDNLKSAMGTFLNHKPGLDTSRIKFNVLDVSFFENKKGYNCEFKVNMKQKMPDRLLDTVGYMSANISKDFTTVSRKN